MATAPPVPPGAFADDLTEPPREYSVGDRSDQPCACVARALRLCSAAMTRGLLRARTRVVFSAQAGKKMFRPRIDGKRVRANSHRGAPGNHEDGRVREPIESSVVGRRRGERFRFRVALLTQGCLVASRRVPASASRTPPRRHALARGDTQSSHDHRARSSRGASLVLDGERGEPGGRDLHRLGFGGDEHARRARRLLRRAGGFVTLSLGVPVPAAAASLSSGSLSAENNSFFQLCIFCSYLYKK